MTKGAFYVHKNSYCVVPQFQLQKANFWMATKGSWSKNYLNKKILFCDNYCNVIEMNQRVAKQKKIVYLLATSIFNFARSVKRKIIFLKILYHKMIHPCKEWPYGKILIRIYDN